MASRADGPLQKILDAIQTAWKKAGMSRRQRAANEKQKLLDNNQRTRDADDGAADTVPGSSRNGDSSPSGPLRGPDGRFITNPDTPTGDSTYKRPSFRAGERERAWEAARDPDGEVRDPVTGEVMNFNDRWVMGHPPGHEHRHHARSARERGLSRDEFIEEFHKIEFRPETPHTSASGKHETSWEEYRGP